MTHKYLQAAEIVRAQVTDGTLKPGQPAPSAAQLARLTGFSTLTCRNGLRVLVTQGILAPGASPAARPRVTTTGGPRTRDAAAALSHALSGLRRANGTTQLDLSSLTGYSVSTIGHAETLRTWQSRKFWEKAGHALNARGQLTRLHDAYRASTASPDNKPEEPGPQAASGPPPVVLVCLALHWSDGTVTTVDPPGIPKSSYLPEGSTPQSPAPPHPANGKPPPAAPPASCAGSASARKTRQTGRAPARSPSPASTSAGCTPTPPSTPSG